MRYNTKLRNLTTTAVRNWYGLLKLNDLINLGNRSSVFYQLMKLVDIGMLVKKGKYYVKRTELFFRSVLVSLSRIFKQSINTLVQEVVITSGFSQTSRM